MFETNKGKIHVKEKGGRFSCLSITAVMTAEFLTMKSA
jgi:hypothetical protein